MKQHQAQSRHTKQSHSPGGMLHTVFADNPSARQAANSYPQVTKGDRQAVSKLRGFRSVGNHIRLSGQMNTILQALETIDGLTVAADYLVRGLQKEGKIKMIWKGETATTNIIYLAYDKTKTTARQVELIKFLFIC